MKTTKPVSAFRLALTFAVSLATLPGLRAVESYYWNPTLVSSGATSDMGGDGFWDFSGLRWWVSGPTNTSLPSTAGTATEATTLLFSGTGNITKVGMTAFTSSGTTYGVLASSPFPRTLSFAAGSNYTITANSAGAMTDGISSGNNTFILDVASGATLSFSGNNGRDLYLRSDANVTGATGLIIQGGGTVNFNAGSIYTSNQNASRAIITGGTIVNFNAGSAIYANGGTSINPFGASSDLLSLEIETATINVDGAALYLGSRFSGHTVNLAHGLLLGGRTDYAQAVFNLNSGTVYALGDYRNYGNPIGFGVAFGDKNTGNHILNLNGGTLVTTGIFAGAGVTTASGGTKRLNLNGGTIKVSTAHESSATTENIQYRLDHFIAGGFNQLGSATGGVFIGANGITFDTDDIDTSLSNGVATIRVSLRDENDVYAWNGGAAGTLIKTGANTLLLAGYHSFSGNITINGGTLAIGAAEAAVVNTTTYGATFSGAVIAGSSIGRVGRILIQNGAIFDTTRMGSGVNYISGVDQGGYHVRQLVTNEGTGKIVGNIAINYGILAPNGSFAIEGNLAIWAVGTLKLDALGTDIVNVTGNASLTGGSTIDLTDATVTNGQLYTLLTATDTLNFTGFNVVGADDFTFTFGLYNEGGVNSLKMLATAIPVSEPATTATLLALATLALIAHRRRTLR
jgi:autotransporter-associated beta strand protein